jgi:hypothetical protein
MAELLQIAADFPVIVDLAVKGDDGVSTLGTFQDKRLIPGIQADDLETRRAQLNRVRLENALLIGAAMNQGIDGAANTRGVRPALRMGKTGDAAQISDPPAPA